MSRRSAKLSPSQPAAAVAVAPSRNGGPENGVPFSNQLLMAMLSFRDGDFAVRMPSTLTGVDGKIADAFNDIVSFSERRARETVRVSRSVGKEGKLKERMIVPEGIGGWADEVGAVNMQVYVRSNRQR